MLEEMKEHVCRANLELVSSGLVVQTWGNASGIDRVKGLVVIKPSGVSYSQMQPSHMVVVSLKTGDVVEGELCPSTDTPTHLELYRASEKVGGIVHTHSMHATAWAQACRGIPALGTTHADAYYGPVPCTRSLNSAEIRSRYEANTAKVIIERLGEKDPLSIPAVLVARHGPFTWGKSPQEAVENAVVLEQVAQMALASLTINPAIKSIPRQLMDRHYLRKHGKNAYYGNRTPARTRAR